MRRGMSRGVTWRGAACDAACGAVRSQTDRTGAERVPKNRSCPWVKVKGWVKVGVEVGVEHGRGGAVQVGEDMVVTKVAEGLPLLGELQ